MTVTKPSTTTTKPSTATKRAAANLKGTKMFELTAEHETALASNAGRKRKQSEYHVEVGEAAKVPGKMFGLPIPEGTKHTTIMSQLRRAAEEHNVKLKIQARPEAATPFVAFSVVSLNADS